MTSASFRLHLFKSNPVGTALTNGDNGALDVNDLTVGDYIGFFNFDMTGTIGDIFSDANQMVSQPFSSSQIIVDVRDNDIIYGLLEARDAYTPASVEVFSAGLEAVIY